MGFLLLLVDVFVLCGIFLISIFSSCPEVKLTHEQQRILNHKIEYGQVVKIMAFAGKSRKLCCRNKRITFNSAPSLSASSIQGTVCMLGDQPYF